MKRVSEFQVALKQLPNAAKKNKLNRVRVQVNTRQSKT